jgi:nucleoside-diphosphate-sugar epimerase
MEKELHVIFGTGPVGCWTARYLRERNISVRAVNRDGKRPDLMPDDVEVVAADVYDSSQAMDACVGATVVYQALNPPYHQWHKYFPKLQAGVLAASRAVGARYVSIENLYMYDSSDLITEDTPIRPRSKKGELRAEMAEEVMEAHQRGDIQATALRSSDYYGPGVIGSVLGDRVFGNLIAGKKAEVMGSSRTAHSWAYIEDVGRAAATLGTSDEALGKAWIAPHAPPCTQGEMVELACRIVGIEPRFMVVSPLMLKVAGLFMPVARASVEMMYQFKEPFVVDSKSIQRAFGLKPTPIQIGIEKTVMWYKEKTRKG